MLQNSQRVHLDDVAKQLNRRPWEWRDFGWKDEPCKGLASHVPVYLEYP